MGLPVMRPWSLPEAMSEPLKVTLPMTTPRTTKMAVETSSSGVPDDVAVVEEGHDGGRAAAHRVEERDQLGHGRHGHAQRHAEAHGATDEEAAHDDDEALGRDAALAQEERQEGHDHGQGHAGRGEAVARCAPWPGCSCSAGR